MTLLSLHVTYTIPGSNGCTRIFIEIWERQEFLVFKAGTFPQFSISFWNYWWLLALCDLMYFISPLAGSCQLRHRNKLMFWWDSPTLQAPIMSHDGESANFTDAQQELNSFWGKAADEIRSLGTVSSHSNRKKFDFHLDAILCNFAWTTCKVFCHLEKEKEWKSISFLWWFIYMCCFVIFVQLLWYGNMREWWFFLLSPFHSSDL